MPHAYRPIGVRQILAVDGGNERWRYAGGQELHPIEAHQVDPIDDVPEGFVVQRAPHKGRDAVRASVCHENGGERLSASRTWGLGAGGVLIKKKKAGASGGQQYLHSSNRWHLRGNRRRLEGNRRRLEGA